MEEREMYLCWLVKSPKKKLHEQQVPTASIWEDDFRSFFELTHEENPPQLHQSDYHFHDVDIMENKKVSLNLNLNYEEVLEAWSDRGSLWAAASSSHSSNNSTHPPYMGEVPRMEEERRRRVKRYKEKRHTRLFCKKIRYQVRKLNADKRPRIKGRFVKTDC